MEDILRFLENGSNVTLISPRRYGKTGLIYHIFDSLKEQKKKVELFYVDIYATSCVDDFIAVLAEAVSKELKKDRLVKSFFQKLGRIRPVISQDALSGEPKLSFAFQTDAQRRYSLKALLEFLEHRPTRVIVAIDEFQQIREYEGLSMEALLRTHIQPLTNVQFIFSGSKNAMNNNEFDKFARLHQGISSLYLNTPGGQPDRKPTDILSSKWTIWHFYGDKKSIIPALVPALQYP